MSIKKAAVLQMMVVFLLIFAQSAFAKDCEEGARTQGEVISCTYETYFSPLDERVKTEHRQLLLNIQKHQHFSDNLDAMPNAVAQLKASQDAWSQYRDATCEFVFNKNGGQTVNWGDRYNCLMDFDRTRLKTLQRYQKELNEAR